MERIWLDVPFKEKDEVKELGARWAPDAKRWFAPRPGMKRLKRWAAETGAGTWCGARDAAHPGRCWWR
ncbi:DUF5710 domain-containing protein [Promicromonospora sp. NPDC057488]|uniref:DUF5710 domain-containing protein n=1 Tax=Promicromonospora sp. NPDC057488 TaxID=3346147 RepID=UPI00366B340E